MVESFISKSKEESVSKMQRAFYDTKGVEQYNDDCLILRIDYDKYTKIINDYFRAVLVKNEISERVYHLTTLLISVSPANYMGWLVRRKCIDQKELNIKIEDEQDWVDSITELNQKNYQIWHHRKYMCEISGDYQRELDIINEVFIEEPKNYHAWCHRIWVVRRYDLYLSEFDFVNHLIERDQRNNSAWNYRFFLVNSCHTIVNRENVDSKVDNKTDKIISDIRGYIDNISLTKEVNYSSKFIKKDVDNESVYSYIKGLYYNSDINRENKHLYDNSEIVSLLDEVNIENPKCYHVISIKLDLLIEKRNKLNKENDKELIEKIDLQADMLFDKLKEIDYIRSKYWAWRKSNYRNSLTK